METSIFPDFALEVAFSSEHAATLPRAASTSQTATSKSGPRAFPRQPKVESTFENGKYTEGEAAMKEMRCTEDQEPCVQHAPQ